jgi:hypothetical protein
MRARKSAAGLRSPSSVAGRPGPPRTTPRNPGQANRLRRWLRRPATWLITIVSGAIGLLLTQIITGLPAQFVDPDWVKDLLRRGPEVVVAAKVVDRDANGFSMVVPGDYQLDPKYQSMVGAAADAEFGRDLYEAGGVRMSPVTLELVVTGRRNQEIRILDISPVVLKRTDPLGGKAFLLPGQGESANLEMVIDFDASNPIARESAGEPDGAEPRLGEPYFNNHTITLRDNEQVALAIPVRVARYYVEFDLKFDYLVGTEEKSLTVDNDGQHFRVTGMQTGPDPDSLPYQRVFIMRGDFSICPINDPREMSRGSEECFE